MTVEEALKEIDAHLNGDEWELEQNPLNSFEQATQTLAAEVRRLREGWQPIETAPKDGTWILAINAETNKSRQHVVHYSTRHSEKFPWVTNSAPMSFVAGITHWQPLPEPPYGR